MALTFFGILGALALWQFESARAAKILWGTGVVFASVYYVAPPLRRPLHAGWMRAVTPVGWVVSHVVLGFIYYLVITPIGLLMRLLRRDRLQLSSGENATSYWVEHKTSDDPSRYFRQS